MLVDVVALLDDRVEIVEVVIGGRAIPSVPFLVLLWQSVQYFSMKA